MKRNRALQKLPNAFSIGKVFVPLKNSKVKRPPFIFLSCLGPIAEFLVYPFRDFMYRPKKKKLMYRFYFSFILC